MNTLEKIRYLCEKKGISISALEKELGYGNASLSKAKNIPFERISKLSDFFGVRLEYFRDDYLNEDPLFCDSTYDPSSLRLSDRAIQIALSYDQADERTRTAVEVALGIDFEKDRAVERSCG